MTTIQSTATQPNTQSYTGGCHCGAVRFQVQTAEPLTQAGRCNCSICTKTSVTAHIVKPAAFRVLAGEDQLSSYAWGPKISQRYFCKHCGIHCFGRGHLEEVGGDYVSINANCLDDVDPSLLNIDHWDGRHNNWQAGPRAKPWPIQADNAA